MLLLFDLDGTLIDSRRDIATAVNLVRRDYDLPALPVATVTGFVGDGIRVLVERALQGTEIDVVEATKRCAAYYGAHLHDETTLYPGVDAGLRRLHEADHRLAVISNKPNRSCMEILAHFGLLPLFRHVLGGGDTQNLKPHPDPLLEVMAAEHTTAERTWMIGDHRTDLEAARRAGVRSIFLTYGMGDATGEEATIQMDSFDEVVAFFLTDTH